MAETLTIICDRCHARTPKPERTRVRWAPRGPGSGGTYDLCYGCAEWLAGELHLAAAPDAVTVPQPAA